ncbi:MAG TPA: lytic transglycosylase domain-containing protein [Clostridiales bacterium]|nr:lytic transglycosylase domain-containing protein [Clostridiales bacterium]
MQTKQMILMENTMSQINGVSAVGQSHIIKTNSKSSVDKDGRSFSSYLEVDKDLNDIFERAAEKYNVSVDLLKAIGKAESDFRPEAVSRSGAQGVMQLMPKTAEYLGVKDSFDPEQNIMGGAKYIAELLKKYDGDTTLALAAYNAGMGNVSKYGGVPPFKETQNYVVKVAKFMNQDLDAGSFTAVKSNGPTRSTLPVGPSFSNRYYTVPLASNTTTDENLSLLDSIFSEADYLKLLDMIMKEMEKNKDEDKFI